MQASGMQASGASAEQNVITNECDICCEKFNLSSHLRIKCEYGDCNYNAACKTCVRQYLLNTDLDPHCMQCKKMWTQKFLVNNLNKSYMNVDYRKHKKQFLLEREMSKMPETMDAADKHLKIVAEKEKQKEFLAKIQEYRKEIRRLDLEIDESKIIAHNIKYNNTGKEKEERKTFIMPCPNNDCRGYLSTQYKCQMCNLQTCSKCHEIMGHTKDDDHTCKEENIQTAEMIKKETKGCPSCGTRISKISGCDQMWCPTCHKAFSWKTGKIETGVIHNPHFYEYQRKTNGGAAPRNPGDVPCGGLCGWYDLRNRILNKIVLASLNKLVSDIHRLIAHIGTVDLPLVREKITALSDYTDIRIDYIIKKISKEDMSTKIICNHLQRQKYTELIHIYELFHTMGIEFFGSLITCPVNGQMEYQAFVTQKLAEFNTLRIYCNEQFATISNTYNQTVPQISEEYVCKNKKFTKKGASASAGASGSKSKGKGKAAAPIVLGGETVESDDEYNENMIL